MNNYKEMFPVGARLVIYDEVLRRYVQGHVVTHDCDLAGVAYGVTVVLTNDQRMVFSYSMLESPLVMRVG